MAAPTPSPSTGSSGPRRSPTATPSPAPVRPSTTSSTARSTSRATGAEAQADPEARLRPGAASQPDVHATDDVGILDFPSADSAYHNYAEMIAEINQIVADHPNLVAQQSSIGQSYQGRDIFAHQDLRQRRHRRERAGGAVQRAPARPRAPDRRDGAVPARTCSPTQYGTDSRDHATVVNTREIWIMPDLNPDGGEYDIATGSYRSWRKNRQPNSGSSNVGTDLNRNWGYKWGCCGGSSGSTSSETYRGPSAFSAPETQVVRDFVLQPAGRRRAADQGEHRLPHLLRAGPVALRLHDRRHRARPDRRPAQHVPPPSASRWPTPTATRPSRPATSTSPTATSPTGCGATSSIWAYTFEMYPRLRRRRLLPARRGDRRRRPQRNKDAVLILSEYADCLYRAIGKESQYCGVPGRTRRRQPGQPGRAPSAPRSRSTTAPPAAPRPTPGRPPACRPACPSTPARGQITGTPTTAGTYNVTITATGGGIRIGHLLLDGQPDRRLVLRHQRHRRDHPRQRPPCSATSPSPAAPATPSTASTVAVNIVHTYKGDLVVNLVAPDGTRLPAAQPLRRQRRQHHPDLHRQPVQRGRQRHLAPARAGRRLGRHRLHQHLDADPALTHVARDSSSALPPVASRLIRHLRRVSGRCAPTPQAAAKICGRLFGE